MNDGYSITSSDGIAIIRFLRELSLEEILDLVDIVADTCTGNRRLWDISRNFSLDSEGIRQLADRGKQRWTEPARVAFLAENDLAFGLVKIFEVFRNTGEYQTLVFRDEEEALAWLRAPDET